MDGSIFKGSWVRGARYDDVECNQIFRFGPSKKYVCRTIVELPVIVRRMDGKEDVLKVFTYLVDADVPFL